jgi:hypothetical protein
MMCEECEEFPPQFVAYFNKPGGKLWRPAHKAATASSAIDMQGPQSEPVAVREFFCDDPVARPSTTSGSAPRGPAAPEEVV